MSKEMIISVNGREKKIAILENGQVTEYYIERGEDNAGVVGNIYKGRVQRVLPGMQSAFVDIGLERDAFLYVSDFFDEEEEIQRIVMEKSKQKKSVDEADKEATDEIHKKRLKRDKKIDNVQEKAEIEGSSDEENKAKDSKKKDSKNKKRRGRPAKKDKEDTKKPSKAEAKEEDKKEKELEDILEDKENILDVMDLDFGDSNFERIVDEDDDTGEMLKDAIMQESITSEVRSIEFDMESTDSLEVGSLIDSVSDAGKGFERIADEEEEVEEEKPKRKTRKTAGKKTTAKKKTSTRKKTTAKKTTRKKKKDEEKEEESPDKELNEATKKSVTEDEKEKAPKKTAARKKRTTKKKTAAKTTRGRKKTTRKTRTKAKKDEVEESKVAEIQEDAEASLKESDSVAEMSVRRGSRGGRRRKSRRSSPRTTGKTHNDKSYKTVENNEPVIAENEIARAEFKSKKGGKRRSRKDKTLPKITDLIREGQEVLVQIAKEPIARKGARITSHIALPGRYLVYMPTIEHLGVSRKINSSKERGRLRNLLQKIVKTRKTLVGGFIVRTAGTGKNEKELRDDAQYLVKTWKDLKKTAEKSKSPTLIHQDLDIIQRLLRDQLSDDFTAVRVDSEEEYLRIVEFVNRIQPDLVKRIKFHTLDEPILETYGVSSEIDKALKHRVWLKSGGYLVINQTEALIAIDVNTGKFVGKGNARLEDTITKTNMEAVEEIARQIRLRDLGGIIVLDLIDMEDRRNRKDVLRELQSHLSRDKSPTKVLSYNDFGLIIMTRKRVKQSLERTLCSPCSYCEGAGWVKSAQTVCYEILEESRRISKGLSDVRQTTLRVHPDVAELLRSSEKAVYEEIEEYLGIVDLTGDKTIHQEQFDFAFI